MFEVGFSEMVVIFALALVVLGPERLPKLVSQIGRWAGRARGMARQFRDQLESEAQAIEAPVRKYQYQPAPHSEPVKEAVATDSQDSDSKALKDTHEPSQQRGA